MHDPEMDEALDELLEQTERRIASLLCEGEDNPAATFRGDD